MEIGVSLDFGNSDHNSSLFSPLIISFFPLSVTLRIKCISFFSCHHKFERGIHKIDKMFKSALPSPGFVVAMPCCHFAFLSTVTGGPHPQPAVGVVL